MKEIQVKSSEELEAKIRQYQSMGYNLESKMDNMAKLSKRNYSVGLFIVLLLLCIIPAIIYYCLTGTDEVVITVGYEYQKNKKNSSEMIVATNNNVCSNCGAILPEDGKFCINCGQEFVRKDSEPEKVCSNCGRSFGDEFNFCPFCGEELEEEQDLICDNCGYVFEDDFIFCPKCGKKVVTETDISDEEVSDVDLEDKESFEGIDETADLNDNEDSSDEEVSDLDLVYGNKSSEDKEE